MSFLSSFVAAGRKVRSVSVGGGRVSTNKNHVHRLPKLAAPREPQVRHGFGCARSGVSRLARSSGFWLILAIGVAVGWMVWIYGGGRAEDVAPWWAGPVMLVSVVVPAVVSGVLLGGGF